MKIETIRIAIANCNQLNTGDMYLYTMNKRNKKYCTLYEKKRNKQTNSPGSILNESNNN